MALGAYGIKRPADVLPDDVQVIVHYTANRDSTANFILTQLPANQVLSPYYHNTNTGGGNGVEVLGGLYDLQLPSAVFAQKVYILSI
jgi:hypothetical protein